MARLDRTVVETGSGPTAVTVTVTGLSSSAVQVSWTAATDGVQGVKSYKLYFGTSAGSLSLIDTFSRATRSWTFSSLTASTTYYARVDAVDGYGQSVASTVSSGATLAASSGNPQTFSLVQPGDITFLGNFGMPKWDGIDPWVSHTFEYGVKAMGLGPDGNSIYANSHDQSPLSVARVTIPTLAQIQAGAGKDYSQLTKASFITTFKPTGFDDGSSQGSGEMLRGLLSYNGRLIAAGMNNYDGNVDARWSHVAGVSSTNAANDITGFGASTALQLPTLALPAMMGGPMGLVPSEWRTLMGKPALCTQSLWSVETRNSIGPSVFGFDPDEVGVVTTPSSIGYAYYPYAYLGSTLYGGANDFVAGRDMDSAIAFPSGKRSVLVIGRHGQGATAYGVGTSDPNLVGQPVGNGVDVYRYDPCVPDKGNHSWPYYYWVWAFDANRLLDVKNGVTNPATGQPWKPWEVRPYAYWRLPAPSGVPEAGTSCEITFSGFYDDATRRLYLCTRTGDNPTVSVFSIA
jgi:hypothetical protein